MRARCHQGHQQCHSCMQLLSDGRYHRHAATTLDLIGLLVAVATKMDAALPAQGTTAVDGKGDPYGFDTPVMEPKGQSFPVVFTVQMTAQRTRDLLLELKVQPDSPL